MTLMMEQRSPAIVARACDLGVAMQLTNIGRCWGGCLRSATVFVVGVAARSRYRSGCMAGESDFTQDIAAIMQRLLDAADVVWVIDLFARLEAATTFSVPDRCGRAVD